MKLNAALLAVLVAVPSFAEEVSTLEAAAPRPYQRPFAFGTYGTGWGGAYGGAGAGGRVRWEAFRWLGLDLFGEALLVQTPHGVRHDHPIGFNLFVPFRLTEALRVRPLLGMCAVLSFIEPTESGAPRSDDVLLGVHAGLGAELALSQWISVFAEVQAVAWAGHDRTLQNWTGGVGNEVKSFTVAQGIAGVQVHFGPL